MKFLEAFQYQIYAIIWGIALILLGIFMWHSLFPIAVGSAFLTLGLTVLLFGNGEVRCKDKGSNDG
jgi:hypothetical protein